MNREHTNIAEVAVDVHVLRDAVRESLQRLLESWFPRCLDRQEGGFLCDFDNQWLETGPHLKMLEYQARQTRVAALAASRAGDDKNLTGAALHGFEYLRDRMWDRQYGGWFRMLDRSGTPLESADKHGHGSSYAIAACAACYELTSDKRCLELAINGFEWLEKHARDHEHGGYFPAYQRDGTVIDTPDSTAARGDRDPLGIPYGFKHLHTLVDILDAYVSLYLQSKSSEVKNAATDLFLLIRDKLIIPPGILGVYSTRDWRMLPAPLTFGHLVQLASVLFKSGAALETPSPEVTFRQANSLLEHTLNCAWDDQKGGILYAGSAFGRMVGDDVDLFAVNNIWWVQAELLRSLAVIIGASTHHTQKNRYLDYFNRSWGYITKFIIDTPHYGWRTEGLDTAESRANPKATMWKDASHEFAALLESLVMLEHLPQVEPGSAES